VLEEARVLRSNYSVLEIGRDLDERNEFVMFVIGSVVNPGLQVTLDVHRGCRWIDPPKGQKGQRSERPKKYHTDRDPTNKGSEKTFAKRCLAARIWLFSHIPEY
jgi:hypothetical protein